MSGLSLCLDNVLAVLRHQPISIRIAAELQKTYAPVTFVIPFSQYGLVSQIRPLGRVVNEVYTDEGTELTIIIGNADRDRLGSKYGKQIIKA